MKALTLTLLIIGLTVYIVIGGIIFSELEKSTEDESRGSAVALRNRFLSTYSCVSEEDLEALIEGIVSAYDQGIDLANNASSPSNWDYASGMFFATTVVTTIGYGHISPTTVGGMVFCIFYALLGIPLFAVAAGALGNKLKIFTNFLSRKLTSSCCDSHPKVWHNVRAIGILLTAIFIFIFIPAGIYSSLEEWTYAESVYYCIITLTTIGFGDYVAGQETEGAGRVIYRLLLSIWILFGLAWMASFISLVQELYDKVMDKTDHQVNAIEQDIEKKVGSDKKTDSESSDDAQNGDVKKSPAKNGKDNKGFTKEEADA